VELVVQVEEVVQLLVVVAKVVMVAIFTHGIYQMQHIQ
jgi:hypothetical protein